MLYVQAVLYLGLVPLEDQLHTHPGSGSPDMQTPFQPADSLSQDSLHVLWVGVLREYWKLSLKSSTQVDRSNLPPLSVTYTPLTIRHILWHVCHFFKPPLLLHAC